jgi:hypothetical protein
MPRNIAKIATLTATTIFLLASVASADDMGGESIALPQPTQSTPPSAGYAEAPTASDDDGWHYCTYYILPLTRHMHDSGLPLAGRIFLYPLAAAFDIAQLPFGALAGLAGE